MNCKNKSNVVWSFCLPLSTVFFEVLYQVYSSKERKKQSCKSNKKTSGKFNNYINKQETKGSNNCVGEYKNACKIEKKMFVVVLIGMSQF